MCLLEFFQLKIECMEQQKGDSFSSWIPSWSSCFHHVDMYVDLFFEPRSVEVSLTQTFYDTTPNQPWLPGCNHERSKCWSSTLDLKIDGLRSVDYVAWTDDSTWMDVNMNINIYIYIYIQMLVMLTFITCVCDPRICSVFFTYKSDLYIYIHTCFFI